MITYRKQVSPNATTPLGSTDYVIYELNINGIAPKKMADVEVIASLSTTNDPNNISTIYYRKLQLVDSTLSPNYSYPPENSSFNYAFSTGIDADLYLSEISYVQGAGIIQVKTTNPAATSRTGTCFVHFKINFF
jgi:hypothetical protein